MNLPSSQAPPSALGRGLDMDAPTVAVGVVVSVVLHTTILGLVVLGTWHTGEKIEERIEPKMLEFEEADLLVLGEEKPAEQLPRISNPAPPEVKEDAVNLARKKEPREPEKEVEEVEPEPEEPKKSDSREKMLEALSQMHDSQRPTNEDLPEGSEQGVVGGNLSDAAKANLLGTYQSKLVAEISRNWTVPSTISPEQIKQLQGRVSVYIRLSQRGDVVSYEFKQRSGNEQFDASIERVIRKFQPSGGGKRLPLPENEEVRQIVIRQGLNLNAWEYTGR